MYISGNFLLASKKTPRYLLLNKYTRIYQFGQPGVKRPGKYCLLTKKTGCLKSGLLKNFSRNIQTNAVRRFDGTTIIIKAK